MRVGIWVLAAVIVATVFALPDLDAYQPEAISVAFTVLVLNELIRYQNRLEYKRSIIRQMASRSNDFALDAARIAKDEGWLWDGALRGANLENAGLQGADLGGAHLEYAVLNWAHLEGVNLMDAHLVMASLSGAHLEGANLVAAHLEGAKLRGSHFEGATLGGAHLEAVDLKLASFDRFSIYTNSTRWPSGYVVPDVATNWNGLSAAAQQSFHREWLENRKRILREAGVPR